MTFDDLKKLTTGFIKGWKKGKLKETLRDTAQIAMDEKIKNIELEEKIRLLEDENRVLKGEKKKPKIKPVNSSDINPKKKKKHKKKPKKKNLEIDEYRELDVNKEDLPVDAKFIGTREITVQEIIFQRNNIRFTIKRYYSKELGKVLEGEIPLEYKGKEFGPELRSFVLYQYYKCRVPHRKILEMLSDWGIEMSKGTLCSILNKLSGDFKEDLSSARDAGIKKSSQVHIDDTSARYNGLNVFTFGVSNKYFTSFSTLFRKKIDVQL
ncbi:transposase [bacterium]|nr:transposase [bacterium]